MIKKAHGNIKNAKNSYRFWPFESFTFAIPTGRDADAPCKFSGKMTRLAVTAKVRDLAYRKLPRCQQLLGIVNTHGNDILLGRHTHPIQKYLAEINLTDATFRRQIRHRQVVTGIISGNAR